MKKIPVVVIDKDKRSVDRTLAMLELFPDLGSIKYSNDIYDLEVILMKRIPIIAIIGPAYNLEDLESLLKHYGNSLNYVKIILLTDDLSADIFKAALKFNIHDVLEYPFKEAELKESFKRAENVFIDNNTQEVQGAARECKKVMFFSTKGGAGNTFLSINFSIALKALTKKEVTIYDLKYQFGDVALMLNIYPKNTVYDLLAINKFDEENLRILLTAHSSGIKVMPGPIDPSQGESISVEASLKVFEGLKRMCDYLVIDAPFGLKDYVLSIMEGIDYMFLVATKEVPSIKNLKICLQLLERLGYPKEKTYIVLNRADSKVDFEIDEIEKTIQRKIDIKIPSDRIVPISINKGTPVVMSAPKSSVGLNIFKMLDIVIPKKEKGRI
jgi:pilus assembly protein CpaE